MKPKIVIIGAGPAGLGAAYRLQEMGYKHWEIYERTPHIGGLTATQRDRNQFIWDIGARGIYTDYEYVHKLLDKLIGDNYIVHRRNVWIRVLNHWVPYPFQNNIRYLPKDKIVECLLDLFETHKRKNHPQNFEEWLISTFGAGMAKYFMVPYNRKLWAHPLDQMDIGWIAKRINVIDLERLLKNVICEETDVDWGDNVELLIPSGGMGALFRKLASSIKDHLVLKEELLQVDAEKKEVTFRSGRQCGYDVLLNTIPLDLFVPKIKPLPDSVLEAAQLLKHNSLYSVGVGIEKPCPSDKTWIYFSEDNCCFNRVSYLSNYSPDHVPDSERYYSMICETTYSEHKPVDKENIVEESIEGLVRTGLLSEADKSLIVTTHLGQTEYAYPIPTKETPGALGTIQPYLEGKGIYSRGRFGSWTYESGNMDHSIMQGVEAVNKALGLSQG